MPGGVAVSELAQVDFLSLPPTPGKPRTLSHLLLLVEKTSENECPGVPGAKRSRQLFRRTPETRIGRV